MSNGNLFFGCGQTRKWIIVVMCTLAPAAMLAQPGETDTGEVALFGGGRFGVGTDPVGGGSTGLAFSRYGMGLIEASFMPMGERTLRSRAPYSVPVQNSRLFDFNFSLHVRIPVKQRWAPYGILGAGLLFDSFK